MGSHSTPTSVEVPATTACYAGTRLEALRALQRYVDVPSIITVADSWVHRDCRAKGIATEIVDSENRDAAFKFLSEQAADVVLSAGFPFILPAKVLKSGPLFVNSHPALLPAYKGANAIKEGFAASEQYMGVTVHHMTERVDSGAQIVQESVWVAGLSLQQVYDLLFGVVEPLAITRAIEKLLCGDKSGLL